MPLLENDQSGGPAGPPIGCTPQGWRLRNLQGEFPKMGEPQFPLFGNSPWGLRNFQPRGVHPIGGPQPP